jgi:chromosome segregation ATPase
LGLLEKFKTDNKELSRLNKELQRKASGGRERQTHSGEEKNSIEQVANGYQKRINNLEEECEENSARVSELEGELGRLTKRKQHLDSDYARIKLENSNLKATIENLKNDQDDTPEIIGANPVRDDTLEIQIRHLEAALQEDKIESDEFLKITSDLETANAALKKEILDLKKSLGDAEGNIKRVKEVYFKNLILETTIIDLRREKSILETLNPGNDQLKNPKETAGDLDRELAQAKRENSELANAIVGLECGNEKIYQEMESCRRECEQLRQKLNSF